jgi:hypothetical protein
MSVINQPSNGLVSFDDDPAMVDVIREERLFELAQRKAKVYSQSSLVPKEYQNNVGNVLIAVNMATRMGADTLMVMQNLYVVNGRPGWSSQFLIATFDRCGRFSSIKYRFSGTEGSDDWGCVAYTKELDTGEVIEGTKITIGMARAEKWLDKPGSKWKTMPEQMLRYRAAAFMVRATAPGLGMGLLTREELEDSMQAESHSVMQGDKPAAKVKTTADLARVLKEKNEPKTDAVEVAEVEVEEVSTKDALSEVTYQSFRSEIIACKNRDYLISIDDEIRMSRDLLSKHKEELADMVGVMMQEFDSN